MAVIVSDSRNAAYDGNLSTANAWWRAEAYNLHSYGATPLDLSTERILDVTFANACNLQGIALAITTGMIQQRNSAYYRDIRVQLWQILGTATMSIASPCVVTKAGHGFSGNEEIRFQTTGALPTGIVAGTHYYVNYIDANTFNVSATAGGANINTSGSQSGTHTLYAVRDSLQRTSVQMCDDVDALMGAFGKAFKLTGGYAVDTTASKWQIGAFCPAASGSAGWYWLNSASTLATSSYVAWGDNQVTFSSGNDAIICVDTIEMDADCSLKAYAGATGSPTAWACCGWLCGEEGITDPLSMGRLKLTTTPGSLRTFTMDGALLVSGHTAFRAGTSLASPIGNLQIVCKYTMTTGSSTGVSGFRDFRFGSNYYANRAGLILYGTVPAKTWTTLTNDVPLTSTTITVDDPTGFGNGDTIYIGGGDVASSGNETATNKVISSVVGNVITFSPQTATQVRKAGAHVYRFNDFGIIWKSDSATQLCDSRFQSPAVCVMSGVQMINVYMTFLYAAAYITYPDAAHCSAYFIQDCMAYSPARATGCGLTQFHGMANGYGATVNRCYSIATTGNSIPGLMATIGSLYVIGAAGTSKMVAVGPVTVTNCHFEQIASTALGTTNSAYAVNVVTDNWIDNCNSTLYFGGGPGSSFRRNVIKRSAQGLYPAGLYFVTDIGDNTVDKVGTALVIPSSVVIIGSSESGNSYGASVANTTTASLGVAAYVDYEIKNYLGNLTLPSSFTGLMPFQVAGSMLRFTDTTTLEDKIYAQYGNFKRCGDGLTDTTVHTSGADKFSLRMESTDGANDHLFEWAFKTPTGNILGRDMTVVAWVNIAHANYYGGTYYQLPRLTVNYDDGTTSYAQATAATGWQKLAVNFTPTTAFGQITVTLSAKTDVATEAQRYVYWDDFSVLYPAGYVLNLGGLDLWANALPITPPIATSISALDVWAASKTTIDVAGTAGEALNDAAGATGGGLTKAEFIALFSALK